MFYYLILDASHSNATCDCCKQSYHLIADVGTFDGFIVPASGAADCACTNDLDANDLTINAVDIETTAFNTLSPIILRNKKATCPLLDDTSTTTSKRTRSKLVQHRKSLSESDLLNEIDNALVFSRGFIYSHGKWSQTIPVFKLSIYNGMQ